MEIKILEERTNLLLKRHELRFEVVHATAATPTRESVRAELAKAVNAPKDRVIIERMVPRFGTAVTRGDANVYDSADAAKSISREHILVRNKLKEKVAKASAPGAAPSPPAEAPKPEAAAPPATEAAAPAPAPAPAHPKPATPSGAHGKETADEGAAPAEAPKRGKAHPPKE